MKKNIFQRHELDALLGEGADDFDVDGIIEDATTVDDNGDRIWTAFGDDLYTIIETHDRATCRDTYEEANCFICSKCGGRMTGWTEDDVSIRANAPTYCPNCGRMVIDGGNGERATRHDIRG